MTICSEFSSTAGWRMDSIEYLGSVLESLIEEGDEEELQSFMAYCENLDDIELQDIVDEAGVTFRDVCDSAGVEY